MYLLHQMLNILCTRTVSGNLELCSSCDKHEPFSILGYVSTIYVCLWYFAVLGTLRIDNGNWDANTAKETAN